MSRIRIILHDDHDGITTLTMNRPKSYNVLSAAMLGSLQTALDVIAVDESVRIVIIAANGNAFCAGQDLKEMRSNEEHAFQKALFQLSSRLMLSINQLPQPVIARVNGTACNMDMYDAREGIDAFIQNANRSGNTTE